MNKDSDDVITIRSLQHFLYCPHRWGLIEIDRAWAENFFITRADIIHERANSKQHFSTKGKKVFTAVPVYCDAKPYGLYGVLDCLEATEDKNGITLPCINDRKFKLCIVEYKPTQPKDRDYNEEDIMQVFAQKICVDYTFATDSEGVLYYADTKRRIKLPLKENFHKYDKILKDSLREMREFLKIGHIPIIKKGQRCNGCSMNGLCMPKAIRRIDIHKEILNI